MFDAGIKDDKFALISLLNEKCKVKVKTPVGETDEFELENIEMQGTVTAPLKCTVQVETLGRDCYRTSTGLYQYREVCAVPPLGFIDDIAGVAECGEASVTLNAIVNAKIESKKLQFNVKKCVNMHIGPGKEHCHTEKVHENKMLTAENQVYLGDTISNTGYNNINIKERCKKGHAAISQIKSMLSEINFGRFTIQTGLIFRDSIFMSKILLNSEVWHSVTKSQIEELEVIDRILLRNILNAHSRTGLEWIYADCGKFDVKTKIMIRRLMFLWHVLSRNNIELIRRIYNTQTIRNNTGDWVRLVESDKLELGISLTDEEIQAVSKNVFKNFVKKKATIYHLKKLNDMKAKHSKSKSLNCTKLIEAEYIQNSDFTTAEKRLLFKLRSQTLDVKKNFPGVNRNLWCKNCGLFTETQSHLLQCPAIVVHLNYLIGKTSKLDEKFIYGNSEQQRSIVKIYTDILEVRDYLLKDKNNSEESLENRAHCT